MSEKSLPKEIISLIHQVKLNEAGWWEKSIERIIIATFWMNDENILTVKRIKHILREDYSIKLNNQSIQALINSLEKQKIIIAVKANKYKLTEEQLGLLKIEFDNYSEIETKTKNLFILLLKNNGITEDPNSIWLDFNGHYLLPLISDLGAKTYELISGEGFSHNIPQQSKFYKGNHESIEEQLRNVIASFFGGKFQYVKDYILRQLNAFLFIKSGNLKKDTLSQLSIAKDKKIKLFVDTNFLFSVLKLHQNPANEATESLLKLIETISKQISVELYFTPFTENEIISVLSHQESVLKTYATTENMANAILKSNANGFVQKYYESVKESNYTLCIKDYLSPYSIALR